MKILLEPPSARCGACEIDCHIQRAIRALSESGIRVRGIGRFGSDRSAIVLESDAQAPIALNALARSCIPATLIPRKSENREGGQWTRWEREEHSSSWICPREQMLITARVGRQRAA